MSERKPSVVIVGAGGMGALFGAIVQDGGLAVTLYDVDAAHVDAINRNGLSINGFGGDRCVTIKATTDAKKLPAADLILFQCKAHASRDAAASIRHLIADETVCISFQNGLGNEETIAEALGQDCVVGGLTAMAGYCTGPGQIQDFSRVPSYIGELNGGLSARVNHCAQVLTEAGLVTHASADIRREIWKKLLGNIAMSAASGATNLTSAQCLRVPALKQTSLRALDEALAVAAASGIELDRAEAVAGMDMISAAGGTGDNKSSLCVDILNRRPTEVEYIYGSVIRLADAAGVEVPTLKTLASLVKGLESHYLGQP